MTECNWSVFVSVRVSGRQKSFKRAPQSAVTTRVSGRKSTARMEDRERDIPDQPVSGYLSVTAPQLEKHVPCRKDCYGRIHVFSMLKNIFTRLHPYWTSAVRGLSDTVLQQHHCSVKKWLKKVWNGSVTASHRTKHSSTPCHYIVSASDLQYGGSHL